MFVRASRAAREDLGFFEFSTALGFLAMKPAAEAVSLLLLLVLIRAHQYRHLKDAESGYSRCPVS